MASSAALLCGRRIARHACAQSAQARSSLAVLQRRALATPAAAEAAGPGGSYRLFIDGEYVDADGGATLEVVSPGDGKPFCTVADASAADVDAAVRAARRAFDEDALATGWTTDLPARVAALRSIASQLEADADEFARLESLDCGKTLEESKGDMQFCVDIFRYYADVAERRIAPEGVETGDTSYGARVVAEPCGVVGCITPWNYPLMQAVNKVAPAIAAGCAVVVKPSPLASVTTLMLGHLANAAGVPPGVVNILSGGPPLGSPDAANALSAHPLLDRLSFTGSGPTGAKLLHASADHLRPTSLELGGKGAILVFDDADLDMAARWVAFGIFTTTGQVCSATSRLLVHEGVADELTRRVVDNANAVVVGHPLDAATTMGPLVSAGQRDRVLAMVRAAEATPGVHVAAGGSSPPNVPDAHAGGFYARPTVLTNVPADAECWREEIFGPVLCVRTFATEDEAVAEANDSPYGLAHAVVTRSYERLARVSSRLRAGVVYENCSQVGFASTPFGGWKKSGFGKEWGEAGLDEYLAHKTIVTALGQCDRPGQSLPDGIYGAP